MSVDPLAEKAVGRSPYEYCFSNPIIFVDPDGEWPWPIKIRSFISAPRAGTSWLAKNFRGDGRIPSTGESYIYNGNLEGATSRAGISFTYLPSTHDVQDNGAIADPTIKYNDEGVEIARKTTKVSKNISSVIRRSNGMDSFFAYYEAGDPLTPRGLTPKLQVLSVLSMKESENILTIQGSFYGQGFPSTEAMIFDTSGAGLLLDADREKGSIFTLFKSSKNIFNVNMQIKFDDKGKFIGVMKNDGSGETISPSDWNKQVQDKF